VIHCERRYVSNRDDLPSTGRSISAIVCIALVAVRLARLHKTVKAKTV